MNKKKSMVLIAATLIAMFAGRGANAETATIPVPKAVLVTAFNTVLQSSKILLDDYGKIHGSSWYDNRSYFLLPNGSKLSIPVEEYKYSITSRRQIKYYLDNMYSSHIQADIDGGNIDLVINFESQGEEVAGKCVHKSLGHWKECKLNIERDVNLDNTRIAIVFEPVAYEGGIAYRFKNSKNLDEEKPQVHFTTDVKIANRTCQAFKGICGWIEDKIKKNLTAAVEKGVHDALGGYRKQIAYAIKNAASLKGLIHPSWTITKVASQGSNFVITVERADQVGPDSVRSLTLASLDKEKTASCPTTVAFAATIKTKEAVRGWGRFHYENGGKSPLLRWQAGKNKTITSNATRTVKGISGHTKQGWAQLSIKWVGSDGKTYGRQSNKAAFTVHCSAAIGGLKQ